MTRLHHVTCLCGCHIKKDGTHDLFTQHCGGCSRRHGNDGH